MNFQLKWFLRYRSLVLASRRIGLLVLRFVCLFILWISHGNKRLSQSLTFCYLCEIDSFLDYFLVVLLEVALGAVGVCAKELVEFKHELHTEVVAALFGFLVSLHITKHRLNLLEFLDEQDSYAS